MRSLLKKLGSGILNNNSYAFDELLKYPLEELLPMINQHLPEYTKEEIHRKITLVLITKQHYEILPDYIMVLQDEHSWDTRTAVSLWETLDPQQRDRILSDTVRQLTSPNPQEVIGATRLLKNLEIKDYHQKLILNLLNNLDESVQAVTAFVLGRIPTLDVIEPLITLGTRTTSDEVKIQVSRAICIIPRNFYTQSLVKLREAIPMLLQFATNESNYQVRDEALRGLSEVILVDKLPNHCIESKEHYKSISYGLRIPQEYTNTQPILDLLPTILSIVKNDSSVNVRKRASYILREIGTTEMVHDLIPYAIKEKSPDVASNILVSFARYLPTEEAEEVIFGVMNRRMRAIPIIHLVDVMEQLGSDLAVKFLRERLNYYDDFALTNYRITSSILNALEHIKKKSEKQKED